MQIIITFKKDVIELPIASSSVIQGLIYNAVRDDPHYSDTVHNKGNIWGTRCFKLFTFGELKGKYKVEGDVIRYYKSVKLEIRSDDPYFIQLLLTHFSVNKTVRIGENEVSVTDLSLSERAAFEDKVTVRTASPITVYVTQSNGHTLYYSPYDTEFYSLICSNAKRKWISRHGDEKGFELEVAPEKNSKFVKRATRFKDTFITAWHGSFVLTGTAQTINFLYNVGLGSKNSQGFGMFDIVPSK